jgi:repressor LexA
MRVSERQKQIAALIESWINDEGRAPTRAEIAAHFGLSSLGTVQRHIERLVAAGVIARSAHKRRALRPRSAVPVSSAGTRDTMAVVPLLGVIRAGQPVESFPVSDLLDLPRWLLDSGEHFALRVAGDSMSGEGILDSDLVVVKRLGRPNTGDVVVALVRGEATIKRFFPGQDGVVELRPSAPGYLPIRIRPTDDDLVIQGVVVAVVRRLKAS